MGNHSTQTLRAQGPVIRSRPRRLALGASGFIVMTVVVFAYQFSGVESAALRPSWASVSWGYALLLLVCLPIETVTCATRTWVMTRVLAPHVSFWTCIRAEWANVAVSTLTPTQSWGGPGLVYLLTRAGASLGTALTITMLSCVATLAALLVLVVYALVVARAEAAWPLLLTVTTSIIGVGSAMALVALRPGRLASGLTRLSRAVAAIGPLAVRLADALHAYGRDIRDFGSRGKTACITVCLLSLPFPVVRAVMAYFCVRGLGIEGSDFRQIFEAQLILIILEFFAPSPGGAGVMELASSAAMASTVPPGYLPYYNLLWRSTTLYLPALAGFVCLGWAILHRPGGRSCDG